MKAVIFNTYENLFNRNHELALAAGCTGVTTTLLPWQKHPTKDLWALKENPDMGYPAEVDDGTGTMIPNPAWVRSTDTLTLLDSTWDQPTNL